MPESNIRMVLGALLDDQLVEERKIKESLIQRSNAVVSSSGVLVALVLGAASVSGRAPQGRLPASVAVITVAALALFVVAAATALTVSTPRRQPTISTLWLREIWNGPDPDPSSTSHQVRLDLLDGLRDANRSAARLLVCSLVLEVAAVALLSLAVAVTLIQAGA
ncbi:hypothetical protein ABZ930_36885 [Streptomyces sp. NPDC046716]|uniref:hypothetical protein n=1 Tax=Streptomyces sp. NPDC046716 TaxID=3157093 RepID=UPI0033C421B1